MENIQETIINDIFKKLQAQQEKLIKEKLFNYLGYELDILKESQRRFPRLKIEHSDNEYSYYWNDGTELGERLITFVSSNIDYSDIDNFTLNCDVKYY